jgi:hypothetical protein
MRRALAMSSMTALALLVSAVRCGSNNPSSPGDGGVDGLVTDGAAGTSGTGGGGGSAGIGGGVANCGDPYAAIDPTAVIDDMETPDYMTVRAGGRTGAWWAGGDTASPGAAIDPVENAPAERIPGGRCGSQYAMHVTGHGYTMWAVLSVSMGWGSVDGGAPGLLPNNNDFRTGVTFWARIGDTSSDKVRLAISDKYTRPEGGICVGADGGTDLCYDTHGVDLTKLDTTWRQYRIPFAGLTQRNFGLPRDRLDASSIYTIEFQFATITPFDFWVDDLSFY